MAYNYAVTAHKASAVNHCIVGNFTGIPDDLNVIVGKLSRFEIYRITDDGLKLIREVSIYGSIAALKPIKVPNSKKDLVFMLTHKFHAAILEFVPSTTSDSLTILTRLKGNIADSSSRKTESASIVIVDPACRLIALRLYEGSLKIIPLNLGGKYKNDVEITCFNIRMEEDKVRDIAFLHGLKEPTIVFIYTDSNLANHVKTYEISLAEKEFVHTPWMKKHITNDTSYTIPVPKPIYGAIVIASEAILYVNGPDIEKVLATPILNNKQYTITCHTAMDSCRYLLGDLSGKLFCLILEESDYRAADGIVSIKNMRLELLGETSIPECLSYLDKGYVYVGSRFGDSQLIRLKCDANSDGSLFDVVETYPNLGPITDMSLVDLEKQGQGQLVTCSGYDKDGSLRVIRNGIGINEHEVIKFEGIKGLWSLKIGGDVKRDTHIVVTSNDVTNVYAICAEDILLVEFDGFDTKSRTLFVGNLEHEKIVQITTKEIRLICATTKNLVATPWTPPDNKTIELASCNPTQIVCACRNHLYYFEITQEGVVLVKEKVFEHELACIDISPIESNRSSICAVGFWFIFSIQILEIPTLNSMYKEDFNIEMLPRSIITVKFEDINYLLCAFADGSVIYYHIDVKSGLLKNRKKVTLGTWETQLRVFKSFSSTNVFACSDRPTVIYSSNNKLVFSNVNLKEVTHMCPLDSDCYRGSLALVNKEEMIFGTIDEIKKLHIRTVPLAETPRRLAYQQSTQTFGILTSRFDVHHVDGLKPIRDSASTRAKSTSTANSMTNCTTKPQGLPRPEIGKEVETHNLLIMNPHTFEVLHSHQYMYGEHCLSILSTRLGENNEEYFIVGTSFVNSEEPEPKQGRLIVYEWCSHTQRLNQIAELSIKGAPYSLCEFGSKFLVGINASVNLVELNDRRDLHIECQIVNSTMALFIKRVGDYVLMGDLMRSLSLFAYEPMQSHFKEIARDFNPAWLTEIEIIDDDTFLGAEHGNNLFVCQKDNSAASDQERQQLQIVGLYHLGDSVNVFRTGSLVVQHPEESSLDIKKTILYGTIEGAIGLIASIDEKLYKKLETIQNNLAKTITSVGKIDHGEYRAYQTDRNTHQSSNFLDGDLIEAFLDLSREQMEAVASQSNDCSIEDLIKTLEELTRIH